MHINHLILTIVIFDFCYSSSNNYLRREHTLTKPYADSRWDYGGSSIVTNSHVRLTPNQQSRKGIVWNNIPCMVRNWELHVHFKISGPARDFYGDGIAIWYTKNTNTLGPVFGNEDYFYGLGLFIDTYQNHGATHTHGHPYISAMINNGTLHYDHNSDGTHTELAGCEVKVRNAAVDTYLAIRYEKNKITVSTDVEGKDKWKICFSVNGIFLPTGLHFGATATTGELSDNHDIISMKLYDIGKEEDEEADYRNIIPHALNSKLNVNIKEEEKHHEKPSSWSLSFIFFILLLGILATVAIGYYFYSKQNTKKRLY